MHRIGRTGRAGAKGNAYTFMGPRDDRKAAPLVKLMEEAGSHVSDGLRAMAGGGGGGYGSSMQFSRGGGMGGYGGQGGYGGGSPAGA